MCKTIEQFERSEKDESSNEDRIRYHVPDLLNIEFLANVPIEDSVEMDGVVVDYAKDKRIVAIEVLDASKRTTRKPFDLIDLAIVKSSGSDAVGKEGRRMAERQK